MGVSSPFCCMDSDNQAQCYILFSCFVPSFLLFTALHVLAFFWIDCFPMDFPCTSFEVECSVFIFHAHLHQYSKPKFPVLPPFIMKALTECLISSSTQKSRILVPSCLTPLSVLRTVCPDLPAALWEAVRVQQQGGSYFLPPRLFLLLLK